MSEIIFESFTAAVLQLNSTTDIKGNLKQAEKLIIQATKRGARLVALPECTPYLGPESGLLKNIKEIEISSSVLFQRLSIQFNIFIAVGTYKRSDEKNRIYNCLDLYGPNGSVVASYNKMHLFDVDVPDGVKYQESHYIKPGLTVPSVANLPELGLPGLSICYDVRFPELYRALSAVGSQVFLIPAAFTTYTGEAHWHILLRARAIENLAYVIAPAQVGVHYGKRSSFGHAMIVDPWGEVLVDMGSAPGYELAEIKASKVSTARLKIPALKNRQIP